MTEIIAPAQRIEGEVVLPGDKSISHRALIFGALAEGETAISNLSPSRDVMNTLNILRDLGIQFEQNGTTALIRDRSRKLQEPKRPLNAGNSGTSMRLLAGVLAGQSFSSTLIGDASLQRRPMERIITPLSSMGAHINARGSNYAPLEFSPRELEGIRHEMTVKSAQVKSALLLAGLQAKGETTVVEPCHTRDHSERMLRAMGADISINEHEISIRTSDLQGRTTHIPGDISSASFWIAAATALPRSQLLIRDVGINPTRTGLIDVIKAMGATIRMKHKRIWNEEPVADLLVESSDLTGVEVSGDQIPLLIDELPILAVLATQAHGRTVIRDAEELRIKESDRISVLARNLSAMGANIETTEGGMIIRGPTALRGTSLYAFGDHRIAMACTIAGLLATGPSQISGSEWAGISYPGFYETLGAITLE